MFVCIRRLWRKLSLKTANWRLSRHYTLISEYASFLGENFSDDNQMCWDVLLDKVPKSVEEIYLTLKCGDYNTYSNGKRWNEFMAVLDDLYIEYFNSRLTNRPLPDQKKILSVIYTMRCLNAMHACYLPRYNRENRYAFF